MSRHPIDLATVAAHAHGGSRSMLPTDGHDVTRAREESRGQVIVIMALALVALLSVVGLVIDGGNAFARQRATQNATDASAEAGAGQLLRKLALVPTPAGGWNAEVIAAVQANATQNGITGSLVIETPTSRATSWVRSPAPAIRLPTWPASK